MGEAERLDRADLDGEAGAGLVGAAPRVGAPVGVGGEELVDEAAWGGLEEHTLAGLDPAERTELVRLLAKVEENLCRETEDCPDRRRAASA